MELRVGNKQQLVEQIPEVAGRTPLVAGTSASVVPLRSWEGRNRLVVKEPRLGNMHRRRGPGQEPLHPRSGRNACQVVELRVQFEKRRLA